MEAPLSLHVLNESDTYRELAPPAWARGAIACFWARRGDGRSVRILPDTCTDIVWSERTGALVAGPETVAWDSATADGGLIVGARFLPGAGAALGLPLSEVRDARVPLDALGLDAALSIEEGPESAPRAVARLALRLVAAAPPDPAVGAAVARLEDPRRRVDDLAAELGLSERQLRRRFLATVGYGPKTLQRILRLRRFLGAPATEGLAANAAAAGYADQAHLTRECRGLTGMTPAELVQPPS